MQLVVFLTVFAFTFRVVNCYEFNSKNETEALNQGCEKYDMAIDEGNLGQTSLFPWLGVLRVHLHQNHKFKIAITGIILVKERFAIANANDISKIPKSILKTDSKVMFIIDDDNPWYCEVVDYMPHPEYEVSTVNTVAILELYSVSGMRVKPICWPFTNFNTSNQLYTIGYTDENQMLEKTIYQLQYVDKETCYEFYKRSKLVAADLEDPVNYQCGFGLHSKKSCVWDNGRAVASNSSGQWTLIGLIITGPGCTAPARFLDTTTYMPWLVTSITIDDTAAQEDAEDIIM